MPQAVPILASPSREGKKRRGQEAALSPRPSPPTHNPMVPQERLPGIRSLLSDLPGPNDQALSHFRTPMRQEATGPRPAIPARLSPPPASRRSHIQSSPGASNGQTRSPHRREDRSTSRDGVSPYPLPIHSGPPPSRASYSPSTLGPAPASPYAPAPTDTRRGHSNGASHSLPPPPTPYHDVSNGYASSYTPSRDYRSDSSSYGGSYYGDSHYRDARNAGQPTYHASPSTYHPMQYGYPPRPHTNGNYAAHHQYQDGYNHGSVQFESDESGGQAPRRRRGNLPRDTTDVLKQWFSEHLGHPYPTEEEKQMLCRRTGLQMTQISNWFINARRRRIPELVNQATAETRLRENSDFPGGSIAYAHMDKSMHYMYGRPDYELIA